MYTGKLVELLNLAFIHVAQESSRKSSAAKPVIGTRPGIPIIAVCAYSPCNKEIHNLLYATRNQVRPMKSMPLALMWTSAAR